MDAWIADTIGKMHIHKITQTALAEHMGKRRDYISKILNGTVRPRNAREQITAAVDELIEAKSA